MSPGTFTEFVVWRAALPCLKRVGWQVGNCAEGAPAEPTADCEDDEKLVLATRLRDALAPLNPAPPTVSLEARLPRTGLINGQQLFNLMIEGRVDI